MLNCVLIGVALPLRVVSSVHSAPKVGQSADHAYHARIESPMASVHVHTSPRVGRHPHPGAPATQQFDTFAQLYLAWILGVTGLCGPCMQLA